MAVLRKENLFSDMDGTLLSDDKKVSQENLAAIRLFVKAGGRFSVAIFLQSFIMVRRYMILG